jgi:LCP family protein required for cell wall assembly
VSADESSRSRWPRIIAGIAAGAVLLTTLVGAGLEYFYGQLRGNITSLDVSGVIGRGPNTAVVDSEGNYTPLTILLMGSDSRESQTDNRYGDPDLYTGERSDTTILLHIGADRSFATAVSIPRDTWVTLPECPRTGSGEIAGGFEAKFNTAFEIGGPGCTMKLVEQMTGLEIDHFAVIDFSGFTNVVDALGGVEVCLEDAVNDPQSRLVLPAGTSIVDGEQALAFVRARKTLGDGSDLQRIQRQQAFLSSMIREATDTGLLLNPLRLYEVLDAGTSSLTTDSGLADRNVLQDTALSLRGVRPENVTFLTMPWVERGDGANVIIDTERAALVWASIANDQPWLKPRSKKRDSGDSELTVAPSQISVQVLNGSGVAGRAGEVAAALTAMGYTVVNVADADRPDYTVTEIRHSAEAAESARTVTATFPGSTTVADASSSVITIVVGQDFTSVTNLTLDGDTSEAGALTDEEIDAALQDQVTAPTTADAVRCG